MAISDKTRKILWGRSGNRCVMCRHELIMSATGVDKEAIVGEECHIIAREPNGPRGEQAIGLADRDEYENLILLCGVHHKLVDDQPNTYTVDLLRNLKKNHEQWVKKLLEEEQGKKQPNDVFFAFRVVTGIDLLNIAAGGHAYHFDNEQPECEEEVNLLGELAQNIQDYGDLWDVMEGRDRTLAQFEMNKLLQDIFDLGFVVYGCSRKERIKFPDKTIDN